MTKRQHQRRLNLLALIELLTREKLLEAMDWDKFNKVAVDAGIAYFPGQGMLDIAATTSSSSTVFQQWASRLTSQKPAAEVVEEFLRGLDNPA